jgi:hypothetical protein
MSEPETPLDQVERHIREAEGLIARQEELIADLERHDHAEAAVRGRELLATLRRTLEVAREHRRVLLERGSADASC